MQLNLIRVTKLFLCLIVVCRCFSIQAAEATNFYVDNSLSTSGNGTSWSTAWNSFSKIVWGGTTGIKAGDTLYISSSATAYNGSITVGASGTASAPILISVGREAGHNGTVTIDLSGNGTAFNVGGRSYITIDGGIDGVNHLRITNGYAAVAGDGTTGINIKNIDLDLLSRPIRLDTSSQFTISGTNIKEVKGEAGDFGAAIDVDGSCANAFDVNKIFNNNITIASNGFGPDGIRPCSGLSVYNNRFEGISAGNYTAATNEHTDIIQCNGGSYFKIYNNEFVNVNEAVLNFGVWSSGKSIHDILIYNNIFRIEKSLDAYPEFIRLYANPGSITALYNFKILNNLFIDSPSAYFGNSNPLHDYAPIIIHAYGGNPTGYGNEVRNNIFYNVGVTGVASAPAILIGSSSGFTSSTFGFSNNTFYNTGGVRFFGQSYTEAAWVSTSETNSSTVKPAFKKYIIRGSSNEYNLTSSDTSARNLGMDLSNYFTGDKDGVARPQGVAWDKGPLEFVSGSDVLAPGQPTTLRATGN